MDLSPGLFDDLLGAAGQRISWASSDLCPCRDQYTGQAKQGCPTCGGRGVIWATPVEAWTGVASVQVAKQWAAFGQWESGSIIFSIPEDSPFYACGENDRVVMLESSEPFRAIYTRNGTDLLNYQIQVIDRVFWLDPVTQLIVEGSIPNVSELGWLDWNGIPGAPPDGIEYTLRGRKRPEFYIFQDLPQDRAHFGGQRLPRRVAAKRFDLFGR
jgi:hypothetical protein